MRKLPWSFLIATVWLVYGAHAQYRVRHYTIKDGLAQGGAYYMLKDSRRYQWFLSQDGLTRFDGTRFVNYYSSKTDPGSGPTGDTGTGLTETPNGDLWFGTEQCLNRYHRSTDRFSTIFARDKASKPLPTPTYVIGSDSNRVWFINETEGLLSFDWRTGKRIVHSTQLRYKPLYNNEFAKLSLTRPEIWFVLPENGVVAYNYQTGKSRSFFSSRSDNQLGSARTFSALYADRDGSVWLYDENTDRLVRLDPATRQFQLYPLPISMGSVTVWAIEADKKDNLFLATTGDGVYQFDKRKRTWIRHIHHDPFDSNSLATNSISELLVDNEGILWVNADPSGLDQLVPDLSQIRHYDVNPTYGPSLGSRTPWNFAEDPGGLIWIGHYDGGLDLFDPVKERIIRHFGEGKSGRDSLPANYVTGLYLDQLNRVWVNARKLCRYDRSRKVFVAVNPVRSDSTPGDHRVVAMCNATEGKLFLATKGGLYKYDPVTNRMQLLADPGIRFNRTLYYNPRTHLLYAGHHLRDLVCYEIHGEIATLRFSSLMGVSPRDISPDTDSSLLWVAASDGLYLLSASNGKVVRSWHKEDGLPHPSVYSALPDRNGLRWISTDRGIAVLNPKTGQIRVVHSIEPTEFTNSGFLKTRSGEMYFGSTTGMYRFDPLRQTPQFHALSVNVTGLLINDQSFRADSNLTELHQLVLRPDQRTLTLQFGAIDYFSNGQNRYRYRLVGYDPNWVGSGAGTSARYANLPPGQYTFEVLAADAEGRWMRSPRRVTVVVQPSFWQTSGFKLGVLLLITALAYAGFRGYVRSRLRRQRREFQLQEDSQQAERQRLARDLHDHIGPDLVALKLQLEVVRDDVTDLSSQSTLDKLIRQASQIVTDVRQVSHALLPGMLVESGLVANLNAFIDSVHGRASGVELNFTHSLETTLPDIQQQSILQIAKELISNALKHADATLIDVELYQSDGRVTLTVSDNGKGYDPARVERLSAGIGLNNVRAVVEQMHGQLTIQLKPTGGMHHQIQFQSAGKRTNPAFIR